MTLHIKIIKVYKNNLLIKSAVKCISVSQYLSVFLPAVSFWSLYASFSFMLFFHFLCLSLSPPLKEKLTVFVTPTLHPTFYLCT